MEDSVRFVRNGEVALALERRGGGGRHVLFAHGWISSRRMWYEVAERLDRERFTLHLLDFRGCGRSDRPRGAHALEDYASDLRAAISLIEAPVTLVGHSMGARIAQFVAAERPPGLERLVLVAPGAARPLRVPAARRSMVASAYGSRAAIERFIRASMARDVEPAVMERVVDDALQCQEEHWFDLHDRARADFSARLAAIDVPVLAIAGERDPLAPPSRVKRDVAALIPGSLFVVVRECGHNLPIESPAEIAAAVARW
ncbi:MAG TPA: alpha/beta hydrolase [Verrucomicrobiae bacterium]|nr:alpha/beta hydrolase [Verrucomicrobiae bacterium]